MPVDDKLLSQEAIDALLRAARPAPAGPPPAASRAEATAPPPEPAAPPPAAPAPAGRAALEAAVARIPVELAVVLGDLELTVGEVLRLRPGSVLGLETLCDAPVDIRIHGRTVARAEVVVLEDTYGLRIVENLVAGPGGPPA
jgi:flagellar motor switch protein FliN/FliY